MQAEVTLKKIEVRLSLDGTADGTWLHSETACTDDGQLRIIKSSRYGDADVSTYGVDCVRRWIAEDHERLDALRRGDWWFVCAEAVAVALVSVGDDPLGEIEIGSAVLGGIESDASWDHYKEISQELAADVRQELTERSIPCPNGIAVTHVSSDHWLVPALRSRSGAVSCQK